MISGKVEFQLKGATLTRDVRLIGKMNPYVVIKIADVQKTSAVNAKGSKNPKWCDRLQFHKTNEPIAQIEVFHMRKLGVLDNVLIGIGNFDLTTLNQAGTQYVTVPLLFDKESAGNMDMEVHFLPDVQVGFQQGELVQVGEAPLDMTLRVVSALLTKDTQWFGQMSCYYTLNCGDKKYTSNTCEKTGKNPRWVDQFKIIKLQDMELKIDIFNKNNNTNLGYCTIPHSLLNNCLPGVRTVQVLFDKEPAGQLFLEVSYNSLPANAPVAQLPPQAATGSIFNSQQIPGSHFNPSSISSSNYNNNNPQESNAFSSQVPFKNNNEMNIPVNNQNNNEYGSIYPPLPEDQDANKQELMYPFGPKNSKFAPSMKELQTSLFKSQQQQQANESNLQFQQLSQAQNLQQQQIYQQKVQQQQFKAAPIGQLNQNQQPYQQSQFQNSSLFPKQDFSLFPQQKQPVQNMPPAPQLGSQYQPSNYHPYDGYQAPPPPPPPAC